MPTWTRLLNKRTVVNPTQITPTLAKSCDSNCGPYFGVGPTITADYDVRLSEAHLQARLLFQFLQFFKAHHLTLELRRELYVAPFFHGQYIITSRLYCKPVIVKSPNRISCATKGISIVRGWGLGTYNTINPVPLAVPYSVIAPKYGVTGALLYLQKSLLLPTNGWGMDPRSILVWSQLLMTSLHPEQRHPSHAV